jgi:hypothetical protein
MVGGVGLGKSTTRWWEAREQRQQGLLQAGRLIRDDLDRPAFRAWRGRGLLAPVEAQDLLVDAPRRAAIPDQQMRWSPFFVTWRLLLISFAVWPG